MKSKVRKQMNEHEDVMFQNLRDGAKIYSCVEGNLELYAYTEKGE